MTGAGVMYRLISPLFLTILMSLTACTSDSSKGSNQETEPTPHPAEASFEVSGRVAKGTVANADVVLYPYVAGQIDEDIVIARGVTDSEGRFSLSIESRYVGSPAFLKVQSQSLGTTMRCDLTLGCQGTAFGEDVPIMDETFRLHLGVPNLAENGRYSVTLLTHIAYGLAEQRLASSDSGGGAEANLNAKFVMARANSQVASRFGVIGELISMDVIDSTDSGEVAQALPETIKYSTLGPAIVQAGLRNYPSETYQDAIRSFEEQYLSLGLASNSDVPGPITLAEVLTEAIQIVSGFDSQVQLFSGLINELSSARGLALSEERNLYQQGVASETVVDSGIGKGKAFVKNLRQVVSSIDLGKIVALSDLSQLVNGNAADALDQFGVELDAAQLVSGEQPEYLLTAIKRVSDAILAVLFNYNSGKEVPPSVDGVAVQFQDLGDFQSFTVKQQLNVCEGQSAECIVSIGLYIEMRVADILGTVDGDSVRFDSLNLKVQGNLTHGNLSLQFLDNEQELSFDRLDLVYSDRGSNETTVTANYLLKAKQLKVAMPFRVSNSDAGLRLKAFANIRGDAINLSVASTANTVSSDSNMELRSAERVIVLKELEGTDFNLAGTISNASGETFLASLNLNQGRERPLGDLIYTQYLLEECIASSGGECSEVESTNSIEGETAEHFLALNAAIGFKANLGGVSEPVIIGFSGAREDHEKNEISGLKVAYPGHALSLNGRFNNTGGIVTLAATNLDGTRLTLESGDHGKRFGTMENATGGKIASVLDMGAWIKITFLDGYFESL